MSKLECACNIVFSEVYYLFKNRRNDSSLKLEQLRKTLRSNYLIHPHERCELYKRLVKIEEIHGNYLGKIALELDSNYIEDRAKEAESLIKELTNGKEIKDKIKRRREIRFSYVW